MKKLAWLACAALGLAACTGSEGGGTGGAGGIQAPDTTSAGDGGATSSGSGDAAACRARDFPEYCAFAIAECVPEEQMPYDCEDAFDDLRCTYPECTAAIDAKLDCLYAPFEDGDFACESPADCDAEDDLADACIEDASASCGPGDVTPALCVSAGQCFPDDEEDDTDGYESCMEGQTRSRCERGRNCTALWDAWATCTIDVRDEGAGDCLSHPDACDAQREAWEACNL
jgi:hypothetical protein